MAGIPTQRHLNRLLERRSDTYAAAERLLLKAKAEGRQYLHEGEEKRLQHMRAALAELTQQAVEYRSEMERMGDITKLTARFGGGTDASACTAGQLSPLAFDAEQLRGAHQKVMHGETAVLATRGFNSAVGLLPAEQYGIPTFPQHEGRLLDRLPGYAMEAPSLEYVQVNTVTGNAAIVGEGQPKPEIQTPATKLTITALKLAAHTGISWENISDFDAFTSAVTNELLKKIVDLENHELVYGNPGTGGLNGLVTTPGILTYTAQGGSATPVNHWDDIAGALAKLRTGPALATGDLLLIHPDTWNLVRTEKDSQGRYLAAQPDPSVPGPTTAWGVSVLQSTEFTVGEAIILDTRLFGRIGVRESLVLRTGVSGDDLVRNIVRFVAEERLNVAVERPAAIIHIADFPVPVTARETVVTGGRPKK